MTEEAKVTVSIHTWKRGDRIQVDIHDPKVAGLIRAGYLKINWKEPADAGTIQDPIDPGWADCLFGTGLDAGAVQEAEAQVDGADQAEPGEEDPAGTSAGGAEGTQNL